MHPYIIEAMQPPQPNHATATKRSIPKQVFHAGNAFTCGLPPAFLEPFGITFVHLLAQILLQPIDIIALPVFGAGDVTPSFQIKKLTYELSCTLILA